MWFLLWVRNVARLPMMGLGVLLWGFRVAGVEVWSWDSQWFVVLVNSLWVYVVGLGLG